MLLRRAHAKVNLCLSVGAPEPAGSTHPPPGCSTPRSVAGYHRIASWMACIDLHDEVEVSRAEGGTSRFTVEWSTDAPRPTPIDWAIEQDLAVRAHAALEARAERPLPVHATIRKRIPVGAGLGGGSSDAAAILLALNDLFELRLSVPQLLAISVPLGSDIAYFLDDRDPPRPALVGDFGDSIERAEPLVQDLVLVIPPFACETRAVYRAFDELLEKRTAIARAEFGDAYRPASARPDLVRRRMTRSLAAGAAHDGLLFNDLFLAALRVQPRLGALATTLSKSTRHSAHLTGSGSCLFLLADADRAEKLLAKTREALTSAAKTPDQLLTGCECAAIRARLL